ncbi:hypothetical protein ANAPC3_00946 [Anaplasma phagocytophilum]|nr:hypothetical protein ANAPC3_00946 [Anaplasma phagocytophilum]SBO33086.1 hypothetical protein ANAPC2_01246 [Anaplasma phagocytophilum]SBO33620.1 hypothetical protein ANAPC4_01228 [Anaplasma phagocytophilum]
MMLLIVRLISLPLLLLNTKVKTLLSLPRLLKLPVLKLIRRFVLRHILKGTTLMRRRLGRPRRKQRRQDNVAVLEQTRPISRLASLQKY